MGVREGRADINTSPFEMLSCLWETRGPSISQRNGWHWRAAGSGSWERTSLRAGVEVKFLGATDLLWEQVLQGGVTLTQRGWFLTPCKLLGSDPKKPTHFWVVECREGAASWGRNIRGILVVLLGHLHRFLQAWDALSYWLHHIHWGCCAVVHPPPTPTGCEHEIPSV